MSELPGCSAAILLILSLLPIVLLTAQTSNQSAWQTLSGNSPAIIAKGGFSGLFPDSSSAAYNFALQVSSANTTLWCDVQLTKDGVGVCVPNIKLDNCTVISAVYPTGKKTYLVNGVATQGWFSIDYSYQNLSKTVPLVQGIYSRTDKFDGAFSILSVEDMVSQIKPPSLWLNTQYDMFYSQHNLSMRNYVLSVSKKVAINYISSPEVTFLSSIATTFRVTKTKLVFRFLGEDITEPSINQTYGSLLKNLTFVKTFASAILVPKHYIWPVTPDQYLQPYTSVVTDAHKEGLEIFAADFANDGFLPYNYSYNPVAEYISFIDNGVFSVDGLVSDFPITPSEAVGCFSHIGKNASQLDSPVVVSHNGASGDYPDCTDLAYNEAIVDGADFIDCPIQVTQDGVVICLSSINLIDVTTVATSPFRSRISIIPDLQGGPGIFTFNLTWEEIQKNLTPIISAPEAHYGLVRNPRYKNSGHYMTLDEFLVMAKSKTPGVVITIENAIFMVEKLGYSIIDNVMNALDVSGYTNRSSQTVMIQSTDSSVLVKFRQNSSYKLLYKIDESIRDADASSIAKMKAFADTVAVGKQSIFPQSQLFATGQTEVIKTLQSAGISVYVYVLMNEYVSQPWDFFSDPNVEINTYVQGAGVDGIITDFPKTSAAYKRNKCSKLGKNAPGFFDPVKPGSLLQIIDTPALPPALAPMPVLNVSDVVEPPLPPASSINPLTPPSPGGNVAPPTKPSSGPKHASASLFVISALSIAAFLV